jgi:ribulose-5-phosphate 4-epimerase/fuculose-1-phosphate aldolase
VIQEGYIRFKCILIDGDSPKWKSIAEMDECRNALYRMGLIGVNDTGIGFGNISIKKKNGKIIISGSRTGGMEKLNAEDYCTILDYSFEENKVTCSGKIEASSETLTHAALYECSDKIHCVIHIHSLLLWKRLLNKLPTTSPKAEYGTPEMAYEIKKIYKKKSTQQKRVIVMGGHEEGIIGFGENVRDCYTNLIDKLQNISATRRH